VIYINSTNNDFAFERLYLCNAMNNELENYAVENTLQLFGAEPQHMDVYSLKEWLEERIFELLNHDFNKLVNLLYRIDVYESKAKECFGKQNKEIAKCLAALIWERQWEKALRKNSGI
jgi:hypothetical protein